VDSYINIAKDVIAGPGHKPAEYEASFHQPCDMNCNKAVSICKYSIARFPNQQ
tara:strand:- start:105 stop:263 length:159 start_codon:yes stop_codon:yes gene_type:complete